MLDKLTAIEARYSQIEARLGASETYDDPALVAKLNKEQAELQPLVDTFRTYRRTLDARDQAEALMSDPEMKELAQEHGIGAADGILLDIGVSSHQLDARSAVFPIITTRLWTCA